MDSNQELSPLKLLKQMVISQKSASLPDEPVDQMLISLHQEMVNYDRFVSETVIRVLGGIMEATEYPDTPRLAKEILRIESQPGLNSPLLNQYRKYRERLDKMLAAAIAASNSQRK